MGRHPRPSLRRDRLPPPSPSLPPHPSTLSSSRPVKHPGGAAIILKYAGRDATEAFEPIHPPDALDSLPPDKRLGKVDPSTIPPPPDRDVREKPKQTTSKLPPLSTVVNTDDIEAVAEQHLKPKAWGPLLPCTLDLR